MLIVSLPGVPQHDDDIIVCGSLDGARVMLGLELEATAEAVGIWDTRYLIAQTLAEIAEPPSDIHFGGFVHTITWEH